MIEIFEMTVITRSRIPIYHNKKSNIDRMRSKTGGPMSQTIDKYNSKPYTAMDKATKTLFSMSTYHTQKQIKTFI